MNATRNNQARAVQQGGIAAGLGVDPFGARSLVLSVLLGLTPPRLAARSLVRVGELFGIAQGTMRTALSRMTTAGELRSHDATYELTGPLLGRKAAQDAGRQPAPEVWDGSWWIAIVASERRTVAERRQFRAAMANARMGELRPETWLRPANLPGPAVGGEVLVGRSPLDNTDPAQLATRLWDLPELERRARILIDRVTGAHELLGSRDETALVDTMLVSAAVVRFLRTDPLLPTALRPPTWSADELRAAYRSFDRTFGRLLRQFLDTI